MEKTTIKQRLREAILPRDIIVTIPKTIKWSDYKKELEMVADGSQVVNFKVRTFPATAKGNKCYLVHNGYVRGWMEITGLSEKSFTCSTTGKHWSGKFIERSGKFHEITPIPMEGFRNYRYWGEK